MGEESFAEVGDFTYELGTEKQDCKSILKVNVGSFPPPVCC
jgi:hypothetical protein